MAQARKGDGQTALVTGASAGIGIDLAEFFRGDAGNVGWPIPVGAVPHDRPEDADDPERKERGAPPVGTLNGHNQKRRDGPAHAAGHPDH